MSQFKDGLWCLMSAQNQPRSGFLETLVASGKPTCGIPFIYASSKDVIVLRLMIYSI